MRLITGLLWFLYNIAVIYTLIVYALVYWTPTSNWIAGFMMMSLPVMVVFHVFSLVFWAVVSLRRALVPLSVVLLGVVFLDRTVQLNNQPEEIRDKESSLTVTNYNVLSFSMANYVTDKDKVTTEQAGEWLSQHESDILCFQEFYTRPDVPALDMITILRKAGYIHYALLDPEGGKSTFHQYGLAIFSKYPIVSRRDTLFNNQNGLLQADVLWRQDTISIVNVHLYSMTLKLNDLVSQDEMKGIKRETRGTLRQLRKGFQMRDEEVRTVNQWVTDSPHPVIVCGDFNETPYSYVYGQMSKYLENSFEKMGEGFGFTYNRLPYFIRIDHQFYSADKLQIQAFETLDGIPYSDHYPLVGTYSLK